VSLEAVPDYHQFVDPESEMSLHIIEREARAGRYNSRAEFRADAARIAAAAAAYNTAGTCRFERERARPASQDQQRCHRKTAGVVCTRPPAGGTVFAIHRDFSGQPQLQTQLTSAGDACRGDSWRDVLMQSSA
jgi:Bromodomain